MLIWLILSNRMENKLHQRKQSCLGQMFIGDTAAARMFHPKN